MAEWTLQDLAAWQAAQDAQRRAQQQADEQAYYASPQYQAAVTLAQQTAQRGQMVQDRNYGLEVDKLKAQRDQTAIQQGTAKADAEYKKGLNKLAQQAHELAVGESLGYVNGSPTLSRETAQSNAAQGWAKLGTEQRGPENALQYSLLRGSASGDPLAGAGFRSLSGAVGQGGPQSALQGQTNPASLQGLSAHLLGTAGQGAGPGGAGDPTVQGMLGIANQWTQDPGKAPGQSFEQLGDYGQKVLGSFVQGVGGDPNEVLQRYRQTRFANGAA